jgi:hypothetical protein
MGVRGGRTVKRCDSDARCTRHGPLALRAAGAASNRNGTIRFAAYENQAACASFGSSELRDRRRRRTLGALQHALTRRLTRAVLRSTTYENQAARRARAVLGSVTRRVRALELRGVRNQATCVGVGNAIIAAPKARPSRAPQVQSSCVPYTITCAAGVIPSRATQERPREIIYTYRATAMVRVR